MYSHTDLPSDSKVWVYQSNRRLSKNEISEITRKGKEFIQNWASHGSSLKAAIEIFYDYFIVVFVDEKQAAASGCSIDKSFQFIKELEVDYEMTLLDRTIVAYRENDEILSCRLDEFEELIKEGKVDENTIVFNNLVDTRKDFDTRWEVLLKDSWHRRLLKT